ncbi:MAG: hypothetical protein CBC48_05040 [bacterium TMED88]|nr:hypothetical protein [Deltaproteobacteria bacterium]OUV34915.1 MAG: hypothetical protein CBC48_05040 [bacterium TMED88]
MSAEGLAGPAQNWFDEGPVEHWQLPSNWAQHLLQEAHRRRLVIQGLQRDAQGTLVEVAPESLLKAAAPITRIRQHLSSSGLLTTVSFCRGPETVGLWFSPAEREPSGEPAWRLLLLETLVLVSGQRPLAG